MFTERELCERQADDKGADEKEADDKGADEKEADDKGADEKEADEKGADEKEADEKEADKKEEFENRAILKYDKENIKHSLQTSWTLYVHTQSVSTTYKSAYKPIGKFQTIEDFWNLWNNIPSVVDIYEGRVMISNKHLIAYSLFRGDILPEWEKTNNINGSEWGCREMLSKEIIDNIWKNLVLSCIGENISNCVGLRYINKCNKTRNIHKIEVWMNMCAANKTHTTLGQMKTIIENIPTPFPKFTFMRHNDKKTQAVEYTAKRKIFDEKHQKIVC